MVPASQLSPSSAESETIQVGREPRRSTDHAGGADGAASVVDGAAIQRSTDSRAASEVKNSGAIAQYRRREAGSALSHRSRPSSPVCRTPAQREPLCYRCAHSTPPTECHCSHPSSLYFL